jgi:hypothetical protein
MVKDIERDTVVESHVTWTEEVARFARNLSSDVLRTGTRGVFSWWKVD